MVMKDRGVIEDIKKEASILKSLKHRNVVKYYRSFEFEDQMLVLMELANGITLTKFIELQFPGMQSKVDDALDPDKFVAELQAKEETYAANSNFRYAYQSFIREKTSLAHEC